ncbi:patatin-like phospholipase family protein [Chengkuizengella axinellae]|uniref:Patatin-like phospholipase family protein n=1 Tax=Chengkuizengella axinellae TaxID=3064388 RepID=A0ABT9J577_9BACL|nr:patatin-like phospholipase family protein [Chengkuizengella sp. 2205SS18-9]MDP5276723.1 patatin-like phospholipase family protein [Chengkuizengella sp. 2205SS18-9]
MAYRIMTFDAGALRGAISARLLYRLHQTRREFVRKTNLFAGTSVGSFIAAALASGRTVDEIYNFFNNKRNVELAFGNIRAGGFYFNQAVEIEGLQKLSQVFFQDLKLKDLRKKVIIPSFDLATWTPVYYHNFPNSPHMNELVSDVVTRSNASPVLFRSYQGFLDGVVVASNPSTLAVSFAVGTAKKKLKNIYLFSIGTGKIEYSIERSTKGWGMVSSNNLYPKHRSDLPANWGSILKPLQAKEPVMPLFYSFLEGTEEGAATQSFQLLGAKSFRLNPTAPTSIGFTFQNNLNDFFAVANQANLDSAVKFLKKYW